MPNFTRYAIYFSPERGSTLSEHGANWLGWDVDAGQTVAHPLLPIALNQVTERPRNYGFHGTLKPPFRLAEGKTKHELEGAISVFAAGQAEFSIGRMKVEKLGSFVAIVPVKPPKELADLASACVRLFDKFRANLSKTELEKRRKGGLSPRQDELLSKWGYPYVLEEFRFHLTLTGKLDPSQTESVISAAKEYFSAALKDEIFIREVCLFGERGDGQFVIINRYPLLG